MELADLFVKANVTFDEALELVQSINNGQGYEGDEIFFFYLLDGSVLVFNCREEKYYSRH